MTYPVVGIGSSAGGLEALIELVPGLSPAVRMAYVIVQHMDPNRETLLPEILSRRTTIPVQVIRDRTEMKPRCLYVMPPNTTLRLEANVFVLEERPREGRKRHHPIDLFFESLAKSCSDRSIAIILSGGDSDGTVGAEAIKAAGGIVIAQAPASASVDSMPSSVIDRGLADSSLTPPKIAEELNRLGAHPLVTRAALAVTHDDQETHLVTAFRHLKRVHGVDFSSYKRSTLRRRLERRIAVKGFSSMSEYVRALQTDSEETFALHKDFLIHVTDFFRDPAAFESLTANVLPTLLNNRDAADKVRVWVPGCASGEEVYSLAISMVEYLERTGQQASIQIFGTDVSESAIHSARLSRYSSSAVAHLSEQRLSRFFRHLGDYYEITKDVRDLCVFARQDLIADSPFSRLNLVSCRNVLIYLDAAAQRRVMHLMHYALRPEGFLMLSPSEGIGSELDLFAAIDKKNRIYRRVNTSRSSVDFQVFIQPTKTEKTLSDAPTANPALSESPHREAHRIILSRYHHAGLLIDDAFQILEFHGAVTPYLDHAPGAPSTVMSKMVRPELVVEISPAIVEARKTNQIVRRTGLSIPDKSDVAFEVIPLKATSPRRCYLLLFDIVAPPPELSAQRRLSMLTLPESEKDRRLDQLSREAAATRAYLQAAIEDHEAIKEELRSAHEEVLSSNEEFKSTNEELETAKEELQATNEELTTINDELRHRIEELDHVNEHLREAQDTSDQARASADTIIETVRDPLLVLGPDLRVLRANQAFYRVFNIAPAQATGRLLSEIAAPSWNLPDLMARLRDVLVHNTTLERYDITVSVAGNDFRMHVNGRKIGGSLTRADAILMAFEPWGSST